MRNARGRFWRAIPAIAMIASLLSPLPSNANHPPLAIVSLSPVNNQVTIPPAGINVVFNQCVLAPPSSYVELRSPFGTLVSVFVSAPNCSTIQIGPSETLGSGQYSIFVYGITVGGSQASLSTVFYVDDEMPAAPNPGITHPINDANRQNVRVFGTGEPGSSVFITIDDDNGSTATIACGVSGFPPCPVVGASGSFNSGPYDVTTLVDSPPPTSPGVISTRSIVATVTLTDPAGNVSPARTATAFKDTVAPPAPIIDFPVDNTQSANQRWTVSGTVVHEPGFRHMDIRVFDGGVASIMPRAFCISGTCAWHGTLLLSPTGAHSIFARAVDAAGNVSGQSNTRTYTVLADTGTGPVRPSADLTPAPIRNSLSASGSAFAGNEVQIKIGPLGTVVCQASAGSGSPPNYACGPFDTTTLAAGLSTVIVTDVDANGGASSIRIIKDTEVPNTPSVAFTSPSPFVNAAQAPGTRLNGNAEPFSTISGTVTSSGGGTSILFTASADVFGNWSASTNVAPLNDGTLSACVTSTDARGNVSASGCTATGPTLDETPPTAPVINIPTEGSLVTSTTFSVSGLAGGGAVSVKIFEGAALRGSDSAAVFTGAGISTTLYVDGPKTIRAQSADQAGNLSPFSGPRSFILDANAPSLVSTTPPNGGVTNPSALVTATYADPDHVTLGACSFQVRDKGGNLAMGSLSISGLSCNFAAATNALTTAGSPYTATVQVLDPAGNSSPLDTFTFSIDATPPPAPVFTFPGQNQIVGGPNVTVTGTAEPGALVQIFNGALFLASTTANPNWSVALSFSDGPYTLTAVAVDAAGNVGPGANRSFVVDLTPPSAPLISSPSAGATVPGGTPVTGTADPGTTVKLFEGAILLGQAVANPSWSITPTLTSGPHTVTAFAYDSVNNQSLGTSRSFIVDLSAPAQPLITFPAEGAFLNTTNVTVTGSAESGSTVRLFEGASLLGSTLASPPWSLPLTFTSGTHTIRAQATDLAGNVSSSALRQFTVDVIAPNPPVIVAPIAGSTMPATFAVQGTAEPGALVDVVEGFTSLATINASSTGFFTVSVTLPDGPHGLQARQTDLAGNVSALSPVRSITVDAIAPGAPTITTPAASSINGATVSITGTAEPFGTISILDGATFVGSTQVDGAGNWSKTATFEDGVHGITARQTDAAGNLGPFSPGRTFSTDGTPPDSTITSPTSLLHPSLPPIELTTPTITGDASDLRNGSFFSVGIDRVVVKIFNQITGSLEQTGLGSCTPACGPGATEVTWNFTPSPLAPGYYRAEVVAIDEAGNVQTPARQRTFITLGG